MNDAERWQKNNDEYLAAALRWLRLRLLRLADRGQIGSPPALAPERGESKKGFLGWFFAEANHDEPKLLPPASDAVTGEQIAEAEAAMKAAASCDPPPALMILGRRFGLSAFEQELLMLCAAPELDTRIAAMCGRAQDDAARRSPTFALAFALFDDPVWDVLSPERPLRYWRMIEINQPGAQPLTASPLRADERVVNYLKGLNYLDDRLLPLLTPIHSRGTELPLLAPLPPLPPSQQTVVETVTRSLRASSPHLPVVHLLGANSPSKRLAAAHAAAALGLRLYHLPAETIPAQPGEMETLARLWQRESLLLPVALYIDAHDCDRELVSLNRFIARAGGVLFLDTREARAELNHEAITVEVAKPARTEQRDAWSAALGEKAAGTPGALASQFNLSLPEIERIARTSLAANNGHTARDHVWQGCLISSRPRLDALARRVELKAGWDQLILPEAEKNLLRQIAAQVSGRATVYDDWGFARKMNRGLGISALFAGESGTGKTMAAEVIASQLQLDLYRIDLSAVVSKYIGETEKNLRRVFDGAEDGGAILCFDEADALFGKRSEVKDSHDRYANIEINYLLQRMESYSGLAILTTNMKNTLDQAFMRRLRFIVNFPFPGPAERRQIWRKVFPAETPVEGLDHERLSRLNLTGGSIHNVALNAAFLAVLAGMPVTMHLIFEAARAELRKLERPVNESEFR
jgi:ATPase family associated with various cellular activities (AAA)